VHVAIVGAGALGQVFGVRLASRGGAEVTFVVRSDRRARAMRIERIDAGQEQDTLESPRFATAIPSGADVVLVAVREEQLDASIDVLLDASSALVVVLTPMMPKDSQRLLARHGTRLRPAMVGVVAYLNDEGSCRYWLPRSAPTRIDSTSGFTPALRELAGCLGTAGIDTRLEPHVNESNLATTVAIVPAAMGIDAAGSIDALLEDRALRDLVIAAIKEGLALSGRIGKGASWLALLTPFIGKTMLKVGVSLGKSRSPEAFTYVQEHFGRKLHAQNLTMGRAVIELAKSKGTPSAALEELLARLVNPER
jgi:2-dehydropantoate 2-reductase